MKLTKKINVKQLETILLQTKGVFFANLILFSDESQSRTANKKKALQKLTIRNVTVGASYEAKVNRVLENKQHEEGNFKTEAMSGKTFVEGAKNLAFADKNPSMLYLICDQEHHSKVLTQYFKDGKRISKDEAIAQDLFMPSYFTEKTTVGRGAVSEENNFFRLTPKLENILSITFNKTKYIIEG